MKFIADLHIHSPFSRATSKELTFDNLYRWGIIKGISLIGTGDCTHPGRMSEITGELEPDGAGFFKLKKPPPLHLTPRGFSAGAPMRFVLSGEISSIYKWDGATRKVHNVVLLPDIDSAKKFNARLERIGNIRSDGRPILGLDSRNLLEILLECSADALLVPAHIWTPWFSVLGSRSGFNSIEECFRDLSHHIIALETGLSSDPPMNWRVSSLDRYTLISNSDAHSPGNIGREANLFDCDLTYAAMIEALKRKGGFCGTLEFFPEEGKYHYDGHRACGVSFSPQESREHKGICPTCGKGLTLGVEYRVEELADRPAGRKPDGAAPYKSVLSLDTILGEIMECGSASKKVVAEYERLIVALGPELPLILDLSLDEIHSAGGALLAEAVRRVRGQSIHAVPGYDGEYGIIRAFTDEERRELLGQTALFAPAAAAAVKKKPAPRAHPDAPIRAAEAPAIYDAPAPATVNERQRSAVEHPGGPLIVVAGPGTGKTRTLVERIVWLLTEKNVAAGSVLAVTFGNRAAREMQERIGRIPAAGKQGGRACITTFHRLGFSLIAENAAALGFSAPPAVVSENEAARMWADAVRETQDPSAPEFGALEMRILGRLDDAADPTPDPGFAEQFGAAFLRYREYKRANRLVDFSDLLLLPAILLSANTAICARCRSRWPHVLVDEYQDVNALQYRLLRLLAPPAGDLFAIGDPDQAIYGFRGSDVRYFSRFTSDYPSARTVELDRSYRSTPAILRAGAAVLGPHAAAGKGAMTSDVAGPDRITVAGFPTENAEAEFIVKTIEGLIGGSSHFAIDSGRGGNDAMGDLAFRDIAVLYRVHAAGDAVVEAFDRSGIPAQRAARRSLLDESSVRNAAAILAFAENPAARFRTEDLLRMHWPGLSRSSADRLFDRVHTEYDASSPAIEWLRAREDLSASETASLSRITGVLDDVRAALCAGDPGRAMIAAARGMGATDGDLAARHWTIVNERAGAAATAAEFLASLSLDNEADFYDPRGEDISLMTLHAAKGLEWKIVFIAGCEEGFIPYMRGGAEPDIAEERRLLYVGITRAKYQLHLSHARSRMIHGRREQRRESPFIGEIPESLKYRHCEKHGYSKRAGKSDALQLGLFD